MKSLRTRANMSDWPSRRTRKRRASKASISTDFERDKGQHRASSCWVKDGLFLIRAGELRSGEAGQARLQSPTLPIVKRP